MPKVKIAHTCSLPPSESFEKVKNMLENDSTLQKFDSSLLCQFDESCHQGEIKGKQFKAKVDVTETADGSYVEILVDLPFLLTPLKGQIQSTVARKLEKELGGQSA